MNCAHFMMHTRRELLLLLQVDDDVDEMNLMYLFEMMKNNETKLSIPKHCPK